MALVFISRNTTPNYIALSSDISGGTISGLSVIGGTVYLTDTDTWKIIKGNFQLDDFAFPVTFNGTVEIGTTKDGGAGWTSLMGVSNAAVLSADMTSAAAVTDAPTSGEKLVITDVLISVDTAMYVILEEETSGRDIAKIFLPANGTVQWTPRSKTKLATANKKMTARASVAGNIAVTAHYFSEA